MAVLLLTACAGTTVTLNPEPKSSLCQTVIEQTALVLWSPHWRPDQKDVPLREAAAQQGINSFFETSGCFSHTDVQRFSLAPEKRDAQVQRLVASADSKPDRVLVIVVRELGPIVKLLSSAALVEGGTEVVLDISDYGRQGSGPAVRYSLHWRNGGPGVIKGVATLPADMEAALVAGLKPKANAR